MVGLDHRVVEVARDVEPLLLGGVRREPVHEPQVVEHRPQLAEDLAEEGGVGGVEGSSPVPDDVDAPARARVVAERDGDERKDKKDDAKSSDEKKNKKEAIL